FEADVEGLRVFPSTAEEGHVNAFEEGIERHVSGLRAIATRIEPEQIGRVRRATALAFVPGPQRTIELARQPEKLWSSFGAVAGIGVIERAAKRPNRMQTKITGHRQSWQAQQRLPLGHLAAERCGNRGEEVHSVARGVMPISRPFVPPT